MERYYKRTTILQCGLIGILSGLLLAKTGFATNLQLVLVSFVLLPALVRPKLLALVSVTLIGLNIGLWRGGQTYGQLQNYNQFVDRKITLVGTVTSDSAYEERGQLEFLIGNITEAESGLTMPGTVQVRSFAAYDAGRGDRVEVTGKLRGAFGSRQGYMSYAEVEVLSQDGSMLERLRSRFVSGTYSALPEPHASLGLGFLIGTRSLLPEVLLSALSVTGLTHIVAVSGYNLTILVRLMRRLFAKRSIYLATMSSFALIGSFSLVTGLSPSIVRAAVVSGLALLAWYYGRTIKPTVLLLVAAVVTGLINPLYPWFDLGWYLSFSAFAGVLILAPLIQRRWFKKKPKLLGQILLETTAAQVMAIPIIAVVFGEVSLISLLANLLVLPFIPFAMLSTFVAGLAGMFVPGLSGWLAWPARIVLTYVVDVVEVMARVPWALKQVNVSWVQLGVVYVALGLIMLVLQSKLTRPLDAAQVIE